MLVSEWSGGPFLLSLCRLEIISRLAVACKPGTCLLTRHPLPLLLLFLMLNLFLLFLFLFPLAAFLSSPPVVEVPQPVPVLSLLGSVHPSVLQ